MQIKILSLLAALAMTLSLTACPSQQTEESNTANNEQATEAQTDTHTETSTETTSEPADEPGEPADEHGDMETKNTETEMATEEHGDEHSEEHAEADAKVAAVAGNPENGAKVFMSKTCNACHKISSLEGAVGALGPALDGIAKTAATRKEGMDAMAYIKESIEKPDAHLVDGFQNIMTPGLRDQMSDEEYQDLLAYLMTLKG